MVDLNFRNVLLTVMMAGVSDLGQSCASPPVCFLCLQLRSVGQSVNKGECRGDQGGNKEDFLLSCQGMDALDYRFLLSSSSSVRKQASKMDFRRKQDIIFFLLSVSCQLSFLCFELAHISDSNQSLTLLQNPSVTPPLLYAHILLNLRVSAVEESKKQNTRT